MDQGEERMGLRARYVLAGVAFTVCLIAAGLISRPIAVHFASLYALHGVIASLFYAAAMAFFLCRIRTVIPLAIGACVFGCAMGTLMPVMAASDIGPALIAVAVWFALAKHPDERQITGTAVVFGASCYPVTLAAGVVMGSFVWSGQPLQIATVLIMAALGAGLALLGAVAGQHAGIKTVYRRGGDAVMKGNDQ